MTTRSIFAVLLALASEQRPFETAWLISFLFLYGSISRYSELQSSSPQLEENKSVKMVSGSQNWSELVGRSEIIFFVVKGSFGGGLKSLKIDPLPLFI